MLSKTKTYNEFGRRGRRGRLAGAAAVVIALIVSLVSPAGIAQASVPSWYSDASVGLMVHWGLGIGTSLEAPCDSNPATPPYKTGAEFDTAVTNAGGFDPDHWVDAALAMRADYIIFAAFHSQLGYLKPWTSSVPGSPVTAHDYLADLITAANAASLRVVVYITSDPSKSRPGDCAYLNNAAYRTYSGDPTVDITTPAGWADYSYDVVDELITNYADLDGLWFDGWDASWDTVGLFTHIRSVRPDLVLIVNQFKAVGFHNEDITAIESYGKQDDPFFDPATGAWHAPGTGEYVHAPLDWMFNGDTSPARADLRPQIQAQAAIVGAGFNDVIGLAPQLDGSFIPGALAEVDRLDEYMDWAEESIVGRVAGGYENGIQPGPWSDGAYGTLTSNSTGTTQYLHVLVPPRGDYSRWSSGSWVSPTELDPHHVGPRSLAVDTNGDIWIVDSVYRIWRKNSSGWARMPGSAQDIAAGADGSVWIAGQPDWDLNGAVLKWSGSAWTNPYSGSNNANSRATQVAVDSAGHAWIVNATGQVWRGTNTTFVYDTDGQDIATGTDGTVWIIGPPSGSANGLLKQWTGSGWSTKSGGGLHIAVDTSGNVWMTNSSGEVWRYNGSFSNISAAGSASDISTGLNGSIYKAAAQPLSITIPDSGYTVSAATDLRTASSVTASHSGGRLTVTVPNWQGNDEFGDQIIKLTASATKIYPRSTITATATTQEAGHLASAAVDSSYGTYYQIASGWGLPQTLTLDLHGSATVRGVRIAQPEMFSVTEVIGLAPGSERVKSVTVSVSTNGSSYTQVWTGTLPNQRGGQVIPFTATSANYVRITFNSNWSTGMTLDPNQLRIASVDVLTS
jgi:hypothetical protein